MSMLDVLQRVTSPFREYGVGVGFLYTIDRMLSRLSDRLHLRVYDLMMQPVTDEPLSKRGLSPLNIREIQPEDPSLALLPVRPDILRARRGQRAICLGGFRGEVLVGYMWFCRERYDEDEVRCTYELGSPRESVFDFDFFIFPEHRMGTAFVRLWTGVNQHLRSAGIRFTFSRVTRFNMQSRRAHQQLGARRVARAVFLQLGRCEVMLATLAPYVSASFARRPRVTLAP
jgi:hypothetical protein